MLIFTMLVLEQVHKHESYEIIVDLVLIT